MARLSRAAPLSKRRRSTVHFFDGDAEAAWLDPWTPRQLAHRRLCADVTVDEHIAVKLGESRVGMLNTGRNAKPRESSSPAMEHATWHSWPASRHFEAAGRVPGQVVCSFRFNDSAATSVSSSNSCCHCRTGVLRRLARAALPTSS